MVVAGTFVSRVSRAQRSTKRSEVVRCRPGTVTVWGGPGSAVHRHQRVYARLRRAMALHRVRDTNIHENQISGTKQ
jgi:hypothetical protein